MLTKDQKIRYRAEELLSLAEHGKMFCPQCGNLTIEQQVRMFEEARAHIERAVRRHQARFYQVYEALVSSKKAMTCDLGKSIVQDRHRRPHHGPPQRLVR